MHGKSITEVVEEAQEYKNYLAEEDIRTEGATRVQEFKELNPEMMDYIEDNCADILFLVSMKEAIQKYGVLTQGQFDAVYAMMLEPAELGDKVKDLELDIFKVKVGYSDWGNTYMLLGETIDNELVRVYFSSMSEKNEKILIDKEILKISGFDYEFRPTTDFKRKLTVSGSYDGYKIKRAKIA